MSESKDQDENQRFVSAGATGTLLQAAEMMRHCQEQAAPPAKAEERISVFWRVFGGTILSIAALLGITIYQQVTSSLGELRSNLNSLNESRGDLVKADDFNNRMTGLWSTVKELETTSAAVSALKERSTLMEQLLKQGEEDRKELMREVQQLRERLVVVESRLVAAQPVSSAPRDGK
jgi:vacuolar-type H+-ATPase subunit I/STV1